LHSVFVPKLPGFALLPTPALPMGVVVIGTDIAGAGPGLVRA
jgi:hypothetical protein